MSEQETKKPRTVADIQAEYQGLCTKAGHLQYQVHALSADLEVVNSALRELNIEASNLHKAEEESKAKAEGENTNA